MYRIFYSFNFGTIGLMVGYWFLIQFIWFFLLFHIFQCQVISITWLFDFYIWILNDRECDSMEQLISSSADSGGCFVIGQIIFKQFSFSRKYWCNAVEILREDLKVFKNTTSEVYTELTELLTLDNFRWCLFYFVYFSALNILFFG